MPAPDWAPGCARRLWRGLTLIWPTLRNSLCWNIRNGQLTDFWYDNWLNFDDPLASECALDVPSTPINVSSFVSDSGLWDCDRLSQLLLQHVLQRIAAMPHPNPTLGMDSLGWRWKKNQQFTTCTTYKAFKSKNFGEWPSLLAYYMGVASTAESMHLHVASNVGRASYQR
ncbi:hypothetical protein V6N12_037559 [Hibiscus sabdariffa]|uniref:Uncharacterized protein n=1 Tax=Hibiscus sabdariffa TaxID=183260 RepID=A0ABR2A9F0_9ROSI